MRQQKNAARHTSDTGQALTDGEWLDAHFDACRPEYEAMLRSVGMEHGMRVLDAGCGSGSHLPWIADLVGPIGFIRAIDLAAANIEIVRRRVDEWRLPCPIDAQVGSLVTIPFPDHTFDAVWCANVAQFFTDDELPAVLREFGRVTRPGGIVAVKDVDMALMRVHPADPLLVSRLCEASVRHQPPIVEARGSLRGRELRRWLEQAGLQNVWQRATLIERWAPLRPVERHFFAEWLSYLAELAEERNVPATDMPAWRRMRDPQSPDHPLNDPQFYLCEGQVVAVGIVPGDSPPA